MTAVDATRDIAWKAIQSVFSALSQDYITFITGDAGVQAAYEALHRLRVLLLVERSWDMIQAEYGVPDGAGCLLRLAEVLSRTEPDGVSPKLQAVLKASLDDFFLSVVGDPIVRRTGGAAEIIAKAQGTHAFDATATPTLFLQAYLYAALRQEETGLSRQAIKHLRDFAGAKAKQVITAFETKFYGKAWKDIPQVGHAHFFRILQGESKWMVQQLRTEVAA